MRLLLAQTDRDATAIFTTALEAAGHDVITTDSGDQAIRLAVEHRPDVIVTELVLHMVDGWQVLQVLRSSAPLRAVPILALTSHVEPEGRRKALEAGFAAYLTLPLEPMALVRAVERTVAKRSEPSMLPSRSIRPSEESRISKP